VLENHILKANKENKLFCCQKIIISISKTISKKCSDLFVPGLLFLFQKKNTLKLLSPVYFDLPK
jgi:hypothetical protein